MRSRRGILGGLGALWRLRFVPAVILSLPPLLLVGWYAVRAAGVHAAWVRASGEDVPLSAELFQLHLHDLLRQDLRRHAMPPAPDPPALPVFDLLLARSDLQALNAGLAPDSSRSYVPCIVEHKGAVLPGKVRIRGDRHWHWAGPKKSMKILLDGGSYLDGTDTFNLINEVSPIGVGEGVLLDVLKENGVLAPESRMVRVTLNRRTMGVYLYAPQVDEGLLRQNQRMYGSVYSGSGAPVDPASGRSSLFRSPASWGKVVSWKPEESKDRSDLAELLESLNQASAAAFEAYARDRLSLPVFAVYDAVDAVFGGDQHDWNDNHKLYFDPYRARFEPVAWNLRAWRHEPAVQPQENPLRLRLALLPGYLAERNRIILGLLRGPCSVREIRARLLREIRKAAPEEASDPFWDAYQLLPPLTRALRRMVRPMDEERQALVLESEIKTFSQRHSWLTGLLEKDRVTLHAAAAGEHALALDVVVDGYGAYRLEALSFGGSGGEPGPPHVLWRDVDLDGRLDPSVDEALADPAAAGLLEPAARLVPRTQSSAVEGHVAVEPAPRRYRFFAAFEGPVPEPAGLDVSLLNTVTGWRITRGPAPGGGPPAAPDGAADEVPALDAGTTSVHPWLYPRPRRAPATLGPGTVTVPESRVFRSDEPVTIAPGTTLRLGPGASLIFLGRLEARGTAARPVVVERADPDRPFGGLALQGPGTAGSVLAHVRVRGGTVPSWGAARYSGMVNVHDTRDVTIRSCAFSGNTGSDDALHLGECAAFVLEDTAFFGVAADALDVEFSEGTVTACRFLLPPDECLDCMSSRVTLTDSVLLGSKGNALSLGERTTLRMRGCLVARSRTGMLVKSRSEGHVSGSLFFENGSAVRLETKSPKYAGKSRLEAEILYAVACPEGVWVDDGSAPDVSRVLAHLPRDGSLDHLRRDVLGLEHWRLLGPSLKEMEEAARRAAR